MITPTRINDTSVYVNCAWCGKRFDIPYTIQQERDVNRGALIQNCTPGLDPDMQELLISGTCPTCWKETFGEEE